MTIQEIIDELSKIDDKSQELYVVTTDIYGQPVYSDAVISIDSDGDVIIS